MIFVSVKNIFCVNISLFRTPDKQFICLFIYRIKIDKQDIYISRLSLFISRGLRVVWYYTPS
jgi:hypothetical protein